LEQETKKSGAGKDRGNMKVEEMIGRKGEK
jgi:hypothetical protein